MLDFLCCLSRKRSRPLIQPDERAHLIPREPQPANIDDETTRRRRALENRFTNIVRAKRGKMVNLHDSLPFNLHNRNLSACLDPSSSRSASDSLLASPTSPRYPISYGVHPAPNFYSSPLVDDSRQNSASRSSSIVTPQGYEGEEDEGSYGEEEDRTPILNLRLVNPGLGMGRPLITRGRSSLKYASGETSSEALGIGEESSGRGREGGPTQDGLGPRVIPPPTPKKDSVEDVTSPTSTVMPTAITPQTPTANVQVSISPGSTTSFRIEETTPLILAWET